MVPCERHALRLLSRCIQMQLHRHGQKIHAAVRVLDGIGGTSEKTVSEGRPQIEQHPFFDVRLGVVFVIKDHHIRNAVLHQIFLKLLIRKHAVSVTGKRNQLHITAFILAVERIDQL